MEVNHSWNKSQEAGFVPSDCRGSENNFFVCAGKSFSMFTSFLSTFERKREGMLWYFKKLEANTHTHTLLKVTERWKLSKDRWQPWGRKVELVGSCRLSSSTCRHSLLPTTARVSCLSQMTALRSSKDFILYLLVVSSALLLKIPAQMLVSFRSSDDLFWDEDMFLLEAGWSPPNLFCRTNFSRMYYNLFQSLSLTWLRWAKDSDKRDLTALLKSHWHIYSCRYISLFAFSTVSEPQWFLTASCLI